MKKLLLLCCLSFLIYSCSDDNENDFPAGTIPNKEAEKQINGVIDVLKGDESLSTFRESLSNIDAKELPGKEFTVLAYKNQSIPKAKSTENDSISKQETKRHIVAGRHTIEGLSKLKKLVALSKDTLYINYSEADKSIYINGVLLGKSIVADKSIVFVMDEMIPQAQDPVDEKKKEYAFRVMNINANWKPGETEGSGAAENALITIYEDDKVVKELRTDANGVARFVYREDVSLDYMVKTDTSSMFYHDYMVAGLYTTQEQISKAPVQEEFKAIVGGLRFVDTNKDGKIDSDDSMDREELNNLSKDMIIYLVGKSYTYPKEEIEEKVSLEMVQAAYSKSTRIYSTIDNNYSSLSQRQTLLPTSKIVDSLWNSSYDLIIKVNKRLDEKVTNEWNQLLTYRSTAYLNLVTAFGGVPLQVEKALNLDLARNTSTEVFSQISPDLDQVLASLPDDAKYKSEAFTNSLQILRVQKDYQGAYTKAREAINSGTVNLSPDSGATSLPILHIYLIAAESANELGNIAEATQYINRLLNADNKPSLPFSSQDVIRTTIRNYYNDRDKGVKYLNIQNWGLNSTWNEKYKLLPIPLSVMKECINISQNVGY